MLRTQDSGLEPTRLLCPWGFSRQEYWGGLPFPSPGDLPNPRIEPTFPASPALEGEFFTTEPPWKPHSEYMKWSEVKSLSHVWLFVTPWTVAYQDSPSMEFSRQEYWSGSPFPSPVRLHTWLQIFFLCMTFFLFKCIMVLSAIILIY